MASVDDITQHIDTATSRTDDTFTKAQSAASDAEQVVTGLASAKSEAENLSQLLAAAGIQARAGQAAQAAKRAEALAGTAQTTKSNIDSSVGQLGGLKNDLTELRAQVEALRGLLHAATSTDTVVSAPERPMSTLTTHGVTHGTVQRRAGIAEGPVIFSAADGMTPVETGQAQEYVDAANRANQGGRLSPTGRAKMTHRLKLDKLKAAAQERKTAKEAGEPYGKAVAAHLPDSTWVGRGEPPEGFGRHTNRVNSALGSQSGCYPEGYLPTEFKLDDSWPDTE